MSDEGWVNRAGLMGMGGKNLGLSDGFDKNHGILFP